ncbi:hypothetical protein [Candidatus Aalborgicola defluviihabitans]|uniref:hypothetical protein n=1 Tax=Candidatus Aalborgicola defluviihabitans TaxID=3386187 RepID=UPI001E0145D0|nr:hypothetical protein [Burkholderiales bacterium]
MMVGDEIVNGLSHRGYRVDVIEVATVSVASASARLPADDLALWVDDLSTFDVTMPAAARTSLVLSVTDAGLYVPAVVPGATMDQPYRPDSVTAAYVPEPFLSGAPGYEWYDHRDTQRYNQAVHDAAAYPGTIRRRYRSPACAFLQVHGVLPTKIRSPNGLGACDCGHTPKN